MYTQHMKCCGINEIVGLNETSFKPETFIEWLCRKFRYNEFCKERKKVVRSRAGRGAFILTGAHIAKVGDQRGGIDELPLSPKMKARIAALKDFVETNKLGTVHVIEDLPNPNYGGMHLIDLVTYVPDNMKLLKYAKEKNWAKPNEGPLTTYWIDGS